MTHPPLMSIAVPYAEVARLAMSALLERITSPDSCLIQGKRIKMFMLSEVFARRGTLWVLYGGHLREHRHAGVSTPPLLSVLAFKAFALLPDPLHLSTLPVKEEKTPLSVSQQHLKMFRMTG